MAYRSGQLLTLWKQELYVPNCFGAQRNLLLLVLLIVCVELQGTRRRIFCFVYICFSTYASVSKLSGIVSAESFNYENQLQIIDWKFDKFNDEYLLSNYLLDSRIEAYRRVKISSFEDRFSQSKDSQPTEQVSCSICTY